MVITLPLSAAQLQSTDSCYTFQVVDHATGEPLSGAVARTLHGRNGGYASAKGFIRLCSVGRNSTIEIRSLGYRTDTVEVHTLITQPVWTLTASPLQTKEVVVTARTSAEDVVVTVAKRLLERKQTTRHFTYSLYSIIERQSLLGKTRKHSARETISVVDVRFGDTTQTYITVVAKRDFGHADTSEDGPLYDEQLDHTLEYITIRGHRYPFPLSVEGSRFYDYEFVSRTDGTPCTTTISFTPRTANAPGFEGTVVVCEADTSFEHASFRLVNAKNLPFVDSYEVYQRYDTENRRLWFPVYQRVKAQLRVELLTGISTGTFLHQSTRTVVDVAFDSTSHEHISRRDTLTISQPQSRSVVYNIDTAASADLLQERTVLADSVVDTLRNITTPERRTTSTQDINDDGFVISTFRNANLRFLPILFRSQSREFGWGAGLTLGVGTNRNTVTYGRAKDESIYGARLLAGLHQDSARSVHVEAEYQSTVTTFQRPFLENNNSFYNLLAAGYPDFFYYLRNERLGAGVQLTTSNLHLSGKGTVLRTSTRQPLVDSLESRVQRDANDHFLLGEVGLWYPRSTTAIFGASHQHPFELQTLLRFGRQQSTESPFIGLNVQVSSALTILHTALGDIQLRSEIRAGTTSLSTPSIFQHSLVPRFAFGGLPSDHVSLRSNSLYSQHILGVQVELDLDDLPWRVLGLPQFNGISPRFSLTAHRSELFSSRSYTSTHIPDSHVAISEAGFKIRSFPLVFTSLLQLDLSASWSVNHQPIYQHPFRIVFDISWPLGQM